MKKISLLILGVLVWPGLLLAGPLTSAAVYIRFKPLHASNVYARINMIVHCPPWYPDFPVLPQGSANNPALRVRQGVFSPWAQLKFPVPAYDQPWGTIRLAFFNPRPLSKVSVEIQLATRATAGAVLRTMIRSTMGNIVSLCLPANFRADPAGITTPRAFAAAHLQQAQAVARRLHLTLASRPVRFSFLTRVSDGGPDPLYADPSIFQDELRTVQILGINGLELFPYPRFFKATTQLGFERYMTQNWSPTPGEAAAQATTERKAAGAAFRQIVLDNLQDEPWNNTWANRATPISQLRWIFGPVEKLISAKAYHRFLVSKGLSPANFGAASWSDLRPVVRRTNIALVATSAGAARWPAIARGYYWTIRYTEHATDALYRKRTQTATKIYPHVRTFINQTDEPLTWTWRMVPQFPDWFETGLDNATTMMWSEDWIGDTWQSGGNGLFGRVGCIVDILHAAASRYHQPIGFYVCMDNDATSLRLKAFTAIGHGVKTIYFFDYGPTYAVNANYWSDYPGEYEGVAKITSQVDAADGLVYPGQPPWAAIAEVYSTTTEIWQAARRISSMPIQNERELDHIALNQQHYPMDILNESLLLSRNLSRYKVIYLVDRWLPRACLMKLRTWVKNGGLLCMTPEAGTRDEYNRPVKILSSLAGFRAHTQQAKGLAPVVQAGSSESKVDFRSPGGPAESAPVRFLYRKTTPAGAIRAKVLATFSDGQPAILERSYGKGSILSYTFMPGLNYYQQIAKANLRGYVTHFPAGARKLITFPCRLAQVKKPVEVSAPVVEADLLVSKKGAALILANDTRQAIDHLRCAVALSGITSVTSVERGEIPFHQAGGRIRFSLPLRTTDIVLLRRHWP